jgi:hypothetical protein
MFLTQGLERRDAYGNIGARQHLFAAFGSSKVAEVGIGDGCFLRFHESSYEGGTESFGECR